MATFKVQLFSCAIGLSLIAGALPATAEEMPLPPSVAQDMATGASAGPATAPAEKTKKTKRGKRGAKAAKTKVQGGIETDKSAEENMNTGAETPSTTPTLTPSGGAGLNFRF
jgi:hypothetical protein